MTTMTDPYPSRVSGMPRVLERPHPVVWGASPAPDIALFDQHGFLQQENAVSADAVELCLAEIARIQNDPQIRDDARIVREEGTSAVRSIFDIVELSDIVRDAVEESGAEDIARQILGSEVYIYQSRLNYKPGFHGGAFYWHSDFETWHAEDGMTHPRAVSASIALTRNESCNGPLMIMPGTHRCFVQCAGATPDDYYRESLVTTAPRVGAPSADIIADLADTHGIDVLTGRAGSMTVFDCNALHASGGNISPLPRANIFVVFNSVDNPIGQPFAGSTPRPSFLAKHPPATGTATGGASSTAAGMCSTRDDLAHQ
ncbi:phytanoyl-CoA dioxygenase family protein [Rhodococcus opacus]|uniref:phytanoyl-CoA dioxygenase family protein n=1 Tax=Rhodococcus opacus TaxID=37919 RepID=UPI0002A32F3A|nr:phytanoyl-CoA dioxygenase family protein [Rhodococcus opacus]ELB87260.1 ectoine hydroxylase [Rhodococcus wratislaviensis IFP 2016]MDX5970046.1 phytanoyl-CoA dioxygenase family protein [Rhodococcus opacus]CAG7634427.1 Ectoine dioxygenase [Rhodococcus opacus]